jgi:hypothetical protein
MEYFLQMEKKSSRFCLVIATERPFLFKGKLTFLSRLLHQKTAKIKDKRTKSPLAASDTVTIGMPERKITKLFFLGMTFRVTHRWYTAL